MDKEVNKNSTGELNPGQLDLPEEASGQGQPSKPQNFKSKRSWSGVFKKIVVVLLVAGALAGLGFGVYKFFFADGDSSKESAQIQSEQTTSQEPESEVNAQSLTEAYTSSTLRLDFMYPEDWSVNEVDRGISVISPEFTYITADDEEITGNFKIYIRKGARSVDGKYLGRGFAIERSEKISYSQPESGQREDTYLTAFGLDKPDNFGYFVIQGNFDLKKGGTLGPDYAKEVEAYLIFGGYSDKSIEDDLGTNELSTDTYDQTSQYMTALEIVKSLKLR